MKTLIVLLSVLLLTVAIGQEKKSTSVQEKKTSTVQEKKMTSDQEKKTTSVQEKKMTSRTDDEDMDKHLAEIDKYGKSDFEAFKKDMSMKFGASTKDVHKYRYEYKMNPGDIYHGYTIATATGKSPEYVMNQYREQKSWGKVAQNMGIKPGSNEFHRMKGKSLSGIGKVKSKHIGAKDESQSKTKTQTKSSKGKK